MSNNKKLEVYTDGIKMEELPKIAAKYKIGDAFRKKTIDGLPTWGRVVGKTKRMCIVETVGKKECFLWQELAGV